MKLRLILVTTALFLSACATAQNENFSTINLNGRDYELRTRTMSGASGSFVQNSVLAHGTWRTCLPDSPGDCEAAVRRDKNRSSR